MRLSDRVKKISRLAVMMAAAMILSYVESLLGMNLVLPGIKIGVGNIFLTYIIYEYGFLTALCFGISKSVLSMVFLGRLSSVFYSLTGIICAVCAMVLIKKFRCFSPLGVNVTGSVFHILGQFVAGVFVLGTVDIFRMLPLYAVIAVGCGIVTYIPLIIILHRKDGKEQNT